MVKLKMPLRDVLSDIVEVYGCVDEKGFINCNNYATFDQNVYENFGRLNICLDLTDFKGIFAFKDMDLYNETIKMALQLPKVFIQAINN
jgi:hypothetical protein